MGTKIAEVMTDRPRAITPETSVREAARMMEQEDVGALPIVRDGARLVGIVTDRDITVRAVAGRRSRSRPRDHGARTGAPRPDRRARERARRDDLAGRCRSRDEREDD